MQDSYSEWKKWQFRWMWMIFPGWSQCYQFISLLWHCSLGDRKGTWPTETCATYLQRFSSRPEQEEKSGNRLTWIHLENGCHNREVPVVHSGIKCDYHVSLLLVCYSTAELLWPPLHSYGEAIMFYSCDLVFLRTLIIEAEELCQQNLCQDVGMWCNL